MKNFHRNLNKIIKSYRRIKSKQRSIKHDVDKLHDMEKRTKHLEKKLTHLKRLEDTEEIAKEAKKIIREEKNYLADMEQRVKRTIKWAKNQRRSIRRIKKKI
ncbi:MAG: hypothetical protein MAG795_00996 [Candidatus Woesearchaeota archaeon]|nr:hypothetical protein [Candidatus Woesearchaeota archaeon]